MSILFNISANETQLGKHNPDAPPFPSGHRSPFKDLTNSSTIGNANQELIKNSSQSAYAQMSDEKKTASLERRRVNRQQKIPAARDSVTHEPVAQTHASSIGSVQCTTFSNITNTHTDVRLLWSTFICTEVKGCG